MAGADAADAAAGPAERKGVIMGTPTGATVVYADGTEERFTDLAGALARASDGRVEYHYAYGPDLLPPPAPDAAGMWRYRALLPLDEGPIRYPLPVGGTPLVASPGLRRRVGMPDLWVKDETRGPTGSNKDRATALVLEHALRAGAETVSCASTGNVAVSLAVGAAAAGLRAVIFVPEQVAESKLALMRLAGATVLKVREGYDAAMRFSRQAAATFGWFDRNTGYNPATLEAKKTVAFEIWEQLGREVPDVVVSPIGDGVTLSALAKGFRELIACGAAARLPRIIGVQAEGCQPVKRAWERGGPVEPVTPNTIADGIAVGDPLSGAPVLRDVRESGGEVVAVSDDAMLQAIGTLAAAAGILAEPAGAAALAGLEVALEAGLVRRDERVVVLATGTALKNPIFPPLAGAVHTVHADLDAVRRALGGG
ncbi:MAG: threonine synthase [Sphaerobacter sp.]|nr:threonine synthase [Sphaerobacter sp.]